MRPVPYPLRAKAHQCEDAVRHPASAYPGSRNGQGPPTPGPGTLRNPPSGSGRSLQCSQDSIYPDLSLTCAGKMVRRLVVLEGHFRPQKGRSKVQNSPFWLLFSCNIHHFARSDPGTRRIGTPGSGRYRRSRSTRPSAPSMAARSPQGRRRGRLQRRERNSWKVGEKLATIPIIMIRKVAHEQLGIIGCSPSVRAEPE